MDNQDSKQVGVRVFGRFRPCDRSKSLSSDPHGHFKIIDGKSVSLSSFRSPMKHLFNLDMIFKHSTNQQEIFKFVGEPIIKDVLYGYNGTIFAYGQTGSGKTYSLFGDMQNQLSNNRGLIPRSCEMLFNHIENSNEIDEVTIKASFIEIYKEKLQDLLDTTPKKLKIRQNMTNKSIYIDNVHEEYVSCFEDVYNLLQIGFRNRAVASTLMNQQSSRSHCVLILTIKQTLKSGIVKISKINFADLAGSERVRKTGATGNTLDEAKSINQSLSTLGNVISSLTKKKKQKYIPYRDSKLTYLLQDALGGNTKTSLIVTCSSEKYNVDETISTLRFATRAKKINNKVTVNKQLSVKELQIMVTMYKQKLSNANIKINRLQKLIKLMRSPDYNDEQYSHKIDLYLNELNEEIENDTKMTDEIPMENTSKVLEEQDITTPELLTNTDIHNNNESSLPVIRVNLSPINNSSSLKESEDRKVDIINDQETQSIDSDASSTSTVSPPTPPKPDQDAINIMNDMNSAINEKDKEIERLNEEMRLLTSKIYSQNQEIESIQNENKSLADKLNEFEEQNSNDQSELIEFTEQEEEKKEESKTNEMSELEFKYQSIIDEKLQIIDNMKSEKDNLNNDREQLLLWNQELQRKLVEIDRENDDKFSMDTDSLQLTYDAHGDDKNVSDIFKKQLNSLKSIISKKENDTQNSDSLNEYKIRSTQTSLIIHNLQKKLSRLFELSSIEEQRDLIDAALTSIHCLSNGISDTENELQNVDKLSINTSIEEKAEIAMLKHENEKLIKQLSDMRKTWVAHLDMLMAPNILDNISPTNNDIPMTLKQKITPNQYLKNGLNRNKTNKKKTKIIKPIKNRNKFSIRNMINSLLSNNFSHDSIIKGYLLMCTKSVSLIDFHIDHDRDWRKLYIVLTKNKLLAYRSKEWANNQPRRPLMILNTNKIVSVLRIEQVLSAMSLSSPTNNIKSNEINENKKTFIITTIDDKYVFKTESNELSRDQWIDNVESVLINSE